MTRTYSDLVRTYRREVQRLRRSRRRRIDYYPSAEALRAIEEVTAQGYPASAVIDALVTAGADATGCRIARELPERESPKFPHRIQRVSF